MFFFFCPVLLFGRMKQTAQISVAKPSGTALLQTHLSTHNSFVLPVCVWRQLDMQMYVDFFSLQVLYTCPLRADEAELVWEINNSTLRFTCDTHTHTYIRLNIYIYIYTCLCIVYICKVRRASALPWSHYGDFPTIHNSTLLFTLRWRTLHGQKEKKRGRKMEVNYQVYFSFARVYYHCEFREHHPCVSLHVQHFGFVFFFFLSLSLSKSFGRQRLPGRVTKVAAGDFVFLTG